MNKDYIDEIKVKCGEKIANAIYSYFIQLDKRIILSFKEITKDYYKVTFNNNIEVVLKAEKM